jgi:hypothetical protein
VPETWTDEAVPVNLKNKLQLEMRGEPFDLGPGPNKVPEYLAIFLAARGLAAVVPAA